MAFRVRTAAGKSQHWAVMLHVRNLLLLDSQGQEQVGGAHTWRFVTADDEKTAVERAIAALRGSENFQEEIRNHPSSPPIFEVDEIRTMTKPDPRGEGTAVVFYIDPDES